MILFLRLYRTQCFSGVHIERPVFSSVFSLQPHADLLPLVCPKLGTLILLLSQSLKGRGSGEEGRDHSVPSSYLHVLPLQTSSASLRLQKAKTKFLVPISFVPGEKPVLSVRMLTQVACNRCQRARCPLEIHFP